MGMGVEDDYGMHVEAGLAVAGPVCRDRLRGPSHLKWDARHGVKARPDHILSCIPLPLSSRSPHGSAPESPYPD